MLVNDERSSWYITVGNFLSISLGEKKSYTAMDQQNCMHCPTKQPHSRVRGQWH